MAAYTGLYNNSFPFFNYLYAYSIAQRPIIKQVRERERQNKANNNSVELNKVLYLFTCLFNSPKFNYKINTYKR
jgi:hypothetical protein